MSTRQTSDERAETLPVYEVTRTGLDEAQARSLAKAYGIPAEELILRDGVVSYIDRAGFLNIPTTEVDDEDVVEKLRAMCATGNPDTRLHLRSIDFAALDSVPVLDHETALRRRTEAFASAGLRLESAKPVAGTTKFTIFLGVSGSIQVFQLREPRAPQPYSEQH